MGCRARMHNSALERENIIFLFQEGVLDALNTIPSWRLEWTIEVHFEGRGWWRQGLQQSSVHWQIGLKI